MTKRFLIFILLLLMTSMVFSQDTLTKKEWRKQYKNFLLNDRPWTIEAPLWIPGFQGVFAYGDVEIEGEDGVDPENPIEPPGGWLGDVLSRIFTKDWYLKFFFLTKVAYEKDKFIVQLDGLTGAVGFSTKFKLNDQQIVQANFRSTNIRLYGGYKLVEANSKNKKFRYELFGYIGARAYFQSVYSDLNGIYDKLDFHPFWIEPVLGLQNQLAFKRWFIVVQGDYGGFFDKSKYSIQITGYVYYRTGRITSLKFGWNHLQLNKTGVIRDKDFIVKVTLSGPSVGLVFHF